MMNNYILYVHILPNEKLYFGITCKNTLERWRIDGSGYKTQQLFWRAIQKYGWDNIKHIILMEGLSKEVACECEKYLIAKYQTTNPKYGYNISTGGEHNCGFHFKHTPEAILKISQASKGHIVSKKQRKQISAVHKGKKLSVQTRAKISKSVSSIMTDEYKAKISSNIKQQWANGKYTNRKHNQIPWNKGLTKEDPRVAKSIRKVGEFHHSDEAKLKMSESHRGIPAHNRKQVRCEETGIVYASIAEAQRITGINNISLAVRGINRTAGKFHWRCIND